LRLEEKKGDKRRTHNEVLRTSSPGKVSRSASVKGRTGCCVNVSACGRGKREAVGCGVAGGGGRESHASLVQKKKEMEPSCKKGRKKKARMLASTVAGKNKNRGHSQGLEADQG